MDAVKFTEVNDSKTEYIYISSKYFAELKPDHGIVVGNTEIAPKSCVRNLGVFFDEFTHDVRMLCKRKSKQVHILS